jgi:hypothetical protein
MTLLRSQTGVLLNTVGVKSASFWIKNHFVKKAGLQFDYDVDGTALPHKGKAMALNPS